MMLLFVHSVWIGCGKPGPAFNNIISRIEEADYAYRQRDYEAALSLYLHAASNLEILSDFQDDPELKSKYSFALSDVRVKIRLTEIALGLKEINDQLN